MAAAGTEFPDTPGCAQVYGAIPLCQDGSVPPAPGAPLPEVPGPADIAICLELQKATEFMHHADEVSGPPLAVRRRFTELAVEAQSRHTNGACAGFA